MAKRAESSRTAKASGSAKTGGSAKARSGAAAKGRPKAKGTSAGSSAKRASTGEAKNRRIPAVRANGATVLVTLVVILGIAVLAPTAQRYVAQRQHIAQLEADLAATQESVDAIAAERDRWSDPAYIQSQARGRLLFVLPGDTSYLVLDSATVTKQQQDNISTELHETQASWLDSFVESLVAAGTSPAPSSDPAPESTSAPASTPGT